VGVNKTAKTALWWGLAAVVPGFWIGMIIRTIYKNLDEKEEFRRYVRKTYGYASNFSAHHDHDSRNV
jgi:hypothetical protein